MLLFWATGAPAAFVVSASANITASGAATTAQLTAPAGKSSGADFQAGRIQDDENPADALDLASGKYTELEWAIAAVGTQVANAEVYEFRVVRSSTNLALDTYTLTPQWTITTGAAAVFVRRLNLSQAVKRSSTF